MEYSIAILPGTASLDFSQKICDVEDGPRYVDVKIGQFNDGETSVKIKENIRGRDVYIVQSTCKPVNDNLVQLLLLIDAAKRSTARRVTVVIPYFGYARQDRKDQPRVSISARLVANLIERAGADRVIAMDLHANQLQGFFDIPVDHLYARPVFLKFIKERFSPEYIENSVALAPDIGSAKPTRTYSQFLDMDLAIIDKRRPKAGESEIMNIVGDVKGKNVWIFDDLIDTAGTICNAADYVCARGALDVNVIATHGVFSCTAGEKIQESKIRNVFITDTIDQNGISDKWSKVEVVSVAEMFRSVIERANSDASISSLFY